MVWAIVSFQKWQDFAEHVSRDFISMRPKVAAKDSPLVVAVEMEIISKHRKNANKRVSVLSWKQLWKLISKSLKLIDKYQNLTYKSYR